MTEKQLQAFARSDARRAAQGLPPVRPGGGKVLHKNKEINITPLVSGESAGPSLIDMAKSLTVAIVDTAVAGVKGEVIIASEETVLARQAICNKCPHFNAKHKRCSKCGCNTKLKLQLEVSKCPLKKW